MKVNKYLHKTALNLGLAVGNLGVIAMNPLDYLHASYLEERESDKNASGFEAIEELRIELQTAQRIITATLKRIEAAEETLKDKVL